MIYGLQHQIYMHLIEREGVIKTIVITKTHNFLATYTNTDEMIVGDEEISEQEHFRIYLYRCTFFICFLKIVIINFKK